MEGNLAEEETRKAQQRLLGRAIRDMREKTGLSQEAFADLCGVHRTYIGHMETGAANFTFRNIAKVASALGVKVSELYAAAGL